MIGVDPAKRTTRDGLLHEREEQLVALLVGNDSAGYRSMVALAERWQNRICAVEGGWRCGVRLAQQLAADGETVLETCRAS